MKYTIDVTDEDIREGEPMEPESCPIALAIRRIVDPDEEKFSEVQVGDGSIDFYGPFFELRLRIKEIPETASEFIREFDCDRIVYPISFEIDVDELAFCDPRS